MSRPAPRAAAMALGGACCVAGMLLAGPALADGCRLSKAQCGIIDQESVAEQRRFDAEQQNWGWDMKRLPRDLALIKRHHERMRERARHLPAAVGNEWARLEFCQRYGHGDGRIPGCR